MPPICVVQRPLLTAFVRLRAAARSAATLGCCGNRWVSANGPSHSLSRGGFHLRRNTTPDRCSAISAARALRASHQSAPAGKDTGKDPDFWCAFEDGKVTVIGDEPANTDCDPDPSEKAVS